VSPFPQNESTVYSEIILYTHTLKTEQWTETVVQRCALKTLCFMFNVMRFMPVCDVIIVFTISQIMRAVAAVVMMILNVGCCLVDREHTCVASESC